MKVEVKQGIDGNWYLVFPNGLPDWYHTAQPWEVVNASASFGGFDNALQLTEFDSEEDVRR